MTPTSLRHAVPRLAVAAAALGLLYDAPHLLFDRNYAIASDHALFIPHAVAGIAMLIVLAVVLVGLVLAAADRVPGPLTTAAAATTFVGLFLAAGGTWGEGFMIPYLADIDPTVFADDVGGYLLGIIVLGGVLLGIGWMLVAIVLRRADLLSKGAATAMGVAAVVVLVPLPLTTFVFAVTLAVVTQKLSAPEPAVVRDGSALATA